MALPREPLRLNNPSNLAILTIGISTPSTRRSGIIQHRRAGTYISRFKRDRGWCLPVDPLGQPPQVREPGVAGRSGRAHFNVPARTILCSFLTSQNRVQTYVAIRQCSRVGKDVCIDVMLQVFGIRYHGPHAVNITTSCTCQSRSLYTETGGRKQAMDAFQAAERKKLRPKRS